MLGTFCQLRNFLKRVCGCEYVVIIESVLIISRYYKIQKQTLVPLYSWQSETSLKCTPFLANIDWSDSSQQISWIYTSDRLNTVHIEKLALSNLNKNLAKHNNCLLWNCKLLQFANMISHQHDINIFNLICF